MHPALPLAALLALSLAACSGTQAPTITLESAGVAGRTDEGVVLNFGLLADNPNDDPLPLQDVEYELFLDGKRVFAGTRSAEATVRRFGVQRFTLPAVVPAASGAPLTGTAPYRLVGKITYIAPGALAEALFDIDVIRPTTPLGAEGTVDLDAAPQAPTPAAAPVPGVTG